MKWKEYSLDELINIKHGYAFKGEFFSEEPTDDILLTPGNFAIGGGFKAQKLKYYNGDFPVDYILDENDVIVTMTDLSKEADTLGFSAKVPAWYGKRFLHNQRIGLVKLKTDDFDKDYLYWLMRTFSYQRFVANGATGATVKHTSPTKICQYKFTAPDDKTTQRKIASILSAYDDLIENNLKRIKLLEEKAFVSYKLLMNSEKLIEGKVGDLADVKSGYAFKSRDWSDEGFPVIKIKNIGNNDIDLIGCSFIPENIAEAANKFKLNAGDLLIAMTGATVGKIGMMPKTETSFYLNQRVGIFKPKIQNAELFLFCFFNEPSAKNAVESLASGAAQPNISGSQLESIKLFYPKFETILEFGNSIKSHFQMIWNLKEQNTKLREARDILLPKLMNGQIEV